jgi:HSP20 family protein
MFTFQTGFNFCAKKEAYTMAIVKLGGPLGGISTLQERINQVFEDALSRNIDSDEDVSSCGWRPAVDIYELEGNIVFKVELPGVGKQDVDVEVKDNILTIKGERPENAKICEENYHQRERCCGIFNRSFTMPNPIQPDQVQAKFKDGVLEVSLPKPQSERPKRIEVSTD